MRASFAFCVTILTIGLYQARAEVPLSALVDKDGHIDAHKLTCAQMKNVDQVDANLLNVWYAGWYNGLHHKHFLNYRNGSIIAQEVTAYCKEHPDKRIIDALAVVSHDERAPLVAGTAPRKSQIPTTEPTQAVSQKDAIRINVEPGGPAGLDGEGTLTHNGSSYPIVISGVGAGKSGLVGGEVEGFVYNLRDVKDINGTYGAGGVGFTIVGGQRVAELRNENGALLQLHGVQTGREMNLNLAGITITLK
jgi:hypothetical protein